MTTIRFRSPHRDPGHVELRVRVLGPVELAGDHDRPTCLGPAARRLLALLVVHAGRVVSTDRIAEVLWGADQPEHPVQALHSRVSRLRRTLGAPPLLTRPPGYLLALPDGALDTDRFDDLVGLAHDALVAHRAGEAITLLDRALGLWRGGAYAEFADDEFARVEVARLDGLRVAAEEDRLDAALRVGRNTEVITRGEVLVAAHPLRERPHTLLMLGLYRAGRQADALAVHRDYRKRLADELGLFPSAGQHRLLDRMLRQDPGLDLIAGPTAA